MYELRKEFISLFPIEDIKEIDLNRYVHGRRYVDGIESFCYWLEHKLTLLGKIGGSQNKQYGVYFASGKNGKKDYHASFKYGESLETAFGNVKNEIYVLLKAGEKKQLEVIAQSQIANKFKGKLLSTYFPDTYLSIFEPEYLNDIITHFNLDFNFIKSNEPIYLQLLLLEFKESSNEMRNWSLDEYSVFLNNEMLENYDDKNQIEIDDENGNVKFPSLETVIPDFITELNTIGKTNSKENEKGKSNKKINWVKRQKALSRYGSRGELIVLKAEQQWIIENSLNLKKLIHIADKDDTAGYDIESINLDNSTKYIEVKATTCKAENIEFYLSASELKFAKKCLSYFIYLVFEVHTKNPKIFKLLNPFYPEKSGTEIEPINYFVKINQ